jgi:hypothetical protein
LIVSSEKRKSRRKNLIFRAAFRLFGERVNQKSLIRAQTECA